MRNRRRTTAVWGLLVAVLAMSGPEYAQGSHAVRVAAASRRGRPRKFSRPARPVALTLPEDVIATLRAIDSDLSRAVVRLAQNVDPSARLNPVEVAKYGARAIIIVPHNRVLKERTGVELVPLADGRALIAFDERLSPPELELRIGDALADASLQSDDRPLFEALAEILQRARQSDEIVLLERNIMVLQWTKPSGEVAGVSAG